MKRTLRTEAAGLLFGFGLQFLLGMSLNLFVSLPRIHPGTSGGNYFPRSGHSVIWALSGHGGLALAIHAYLGIGLLLGTVGLFARSLREQKRLWTICSGAAALFTLAAIFNGLAFVDYNQDINSMIMATCWLVSVGAIIFGLFQDTIINSSKKLSRKA